MTKTLFAMLLILFICLTHPAYTAPASDTAARYDAATGAAAQDGAGTVWALPDYSSRDGTVRRRQAGTWVNVAVPETRGFRLLALTTGGAGSVYGLWQKFAQGQYGQGQSPSQCLVTVQHGTSIRALAQFDGAVAQNNGFSKTPKIYAGTGGDVWIAGYAPELRHITASGAVQTFPFQAAWYTNGKVPLSSGFPGPQAARIESLAVGAGHRWFWQDQSPYYGGMGSLSGILVWDGKTLTDQPGPAAALSGRGISALALRDPTHVWLALEEDPMLRSRRPGGLFVLDTRTFDAVPDTPQPGFQNISQLFEAGGDWYAVAVEPLGRRDTSLWRKRGGIWRRVIAALEASGGYYAPDLGYSWLAEPTGLWLGVNGGAWWLPNKTDTPLWVNWRRGLPPLNISGLFPLAGGRLLAVSDSGGAKEIAAAPEPVRPLPPGVTVGGFGAPANIARPFADARQHIWTAQIYETRTPSLDEWDGRQWRIHPVPKTIPGVSGLYACDTRGRLWLSTSNWHPPAQPRPIEGRAVYDPARDTWTNYTTTEDALAAAASLPGMAFLPHRDLYEPPVFSGDGRVAYVSDNTKISMYDGKVWRHWQTGEILRPYGGNSPNLVHFNAERHLEIGFGGPKCEWTPEADWQQDGQEEPVKYQDPVPPGGPKGMFWGLPAQDSLGVKWFQWQGAVYAAGYGLWAKQPELSASGSPFTQGFGIEDVLRDPAGRLFFVSRPAGRTGFIVWSPPPVPKPSLSVTPVSEDSVSVRFTSALPGLHRFLWRVNGGAWSAPTTARTLALTALPRGDYRLEAQALDSRLQVSPSAVAVWSVRVDQQTQIARWVSALSSGPDPAREIAVAGLVKQPAAALPALKAARPDAPEIGKWWIDAAIQQITDAQQIEAGETLETAN